jgi:hypothetical protein
MNVSIVIIFYPPTHIYSYTLTRAHTNPHHQLDTGQDRTPGLSCPVLISDEQVVFHKSRRMRRKKYKQHSNSMMNRLRIDNKYLLNIYLDSQIRNLTSDLEQAREQLDEEQEAKSEFQKQVTKLTAELQQWRSRYESEG